MNGNNLVSSQDSGKATMPEATSLAIEQDPAPRRRAARQFVALVWILIAWIIGTLVSELHVIGSEPPTPPTNGERVDGTTEPGLRYLSIMAGWDARATELALTHSGVGQFERVLRSSRLRPQYESIIRASQGPAEAEIPSIQAMEPGSAGTPSAANPTLQAAEPKTYRAANS